MLYQYEAIGDQGQTVSGMLEADSERLARRDLARRGLNPVSLGPASEARPGRRRARRKGRARPADWVRVLGEMQTLLEGGLPLAEATRLIADNAEHQEIALAFERFNAELRRGVGIAEAAKIGLPALPAYAHQLIRAGEASGALAEAIGDAATQMEFERATAEDIRTALFYPSILMVSGLGAILFIFVVVIPNFAELFERNLEQVPVYSRLLYHVAMAVHDNLWLVLAGLGGLVGTVIWAVRRPAIARRVADFGLRVPGLGGWLMESETARWSAVLATLLNNGVGLMTALELARGAVGLPRLELRLRQVERAVKGGSDLARALEDYAGMPNSAITLVRVGERAGSLPASMRTIARLHADGVKLRTKRLLTVLEPAAIIVIGLVIGFIAVAILTAITSINQIPL